LAMILGPYAGFLTIASVLAIQALFFADGGLLAYGCNLFNIGFFSCFVAYPLVYKLLIENNYSAKRITAASITASVTALQLGALGVVLQTLFSGKTELPLVTFLAFMQPIHLGIGLVEGFVTAAAAAFIWKARPEIMERAALGEALGNVAVKKVIAVIAAVTLVAAAGLSWFASSQPDGLEWSLLKTSGTDELEKPDGNGIHQKLEELQAKTAFLPDYGFRVLEVENGEWIDERGERVDERGEWIDEREERGVERKDMGMESGDLGEESWGWGKESRELEIESVDRKFENLETSVAGVVGGGMTLTMAGLIGLGIGLAKRRKNRAGLGN